MFVKCLIYGFCFEMIQQFFQRVVLSFNVKALEDWSSWTIEETNSGWVDQYSQDNCQICYYSQQVAAEILFVHFSLNCIVEFSWNIQ